jgi:hypothetical protein
VVALSHLRDALFACKACGVKFTYQRGSLFAGKLGPRSRLFTIIGCKG